MSIITQKAPAKINLWLEIASRRPDGYHDIESVMQTVDLYDDITLERLPSGGKRQISIDCSVQSLACDESNLCYRAAQLFFDAAGLAHYSVSIAIEKRIPIAAGLAGGSTDAASTLIGLNRLYGTEFTVEHLCALGARIGADVPFCIRKGIRIARGIGEIFSPCAPLPPCTVLLASDGPGVSTPWAYKRLDEMYDFTSRKADAASFAALLNSGDLARIAAGMTNIFESAVLPQRAKACALKEEMLAGGALNSLMSGSGPAVFGLFETDAAAEAVRSRLAEQGIESFVCHPCKE